MIWCVRDVVRVQHLQAQPAVQRQHRDAHRGARVDAGVAEDLAEQLRGAVGHRGLAGEVRGRGDEHDHLDD